MVIGTPWSGPPPRRWSISSPASKNTIRTSTQCTTNNPWNVTRTPGGAHLAFANEPGDLDCRFEVKLIHGLRPILLTPQKNNIGPCTMPVTHLRRHVTSCVAGFQPRPTSASGQTHQSARGATFAPPPHEPARPIVAERRRQS